MVSNIYIYCIHIYIYTYNSGIEIGLRNKSAEFGLKISPLILSMDIYIYLIKKNAIFC